MTVARSTGTMGMLTIIVIILAGYGVQCLLICEL